MEINTQPSNIYRQYDFLYRNQEIYIHMTEFIEVLAILLAVRPKLKKAISLCQQEIVLKCKLK